MNNFASNSCGKRWWSLEMGRTTQPCQSAGIVGVLVPEDPWLRVGVPWGPWGLWGPWVFLVSLGIPGDSGGHGVWRGEGGPLESGYVVHSTCSVLPPMV